MLNFSMRKTVGNHIFQKNKSPLFITSLAFIKQYSSALKFPSKSKVFFIQKTNTFYHRPSTKNFTIEELGDKNTKKSTIKQQRNNSKENKQIVSNDARSSGSKSILEDKNNSNENNYNNNNEEITNLFKKINIEKINITNKYSVTISNKDFLYKYDKQIKENNSSLGDYKEKVAGRIISIRKLGKNLVFITISSNAEELQIVFDTNKLNENSLLNLNSLKRGFFIGIEGSPYKTKSGETSLLASKLDILSICHYELPDTKRKDKQILTNFEIRYEKRYLDLIVNNKNKEYYLLRSRIISFLRTYLEKDGFLEAETPMLSKKAGGALAVPFETYSQAIKSKLFLRIAPELFLKQLIIGGFEKVFEIGKNFRNEDISIRHNPEFTSCELYHAYADYKFMITFTQNFLKDLCLYLYDRTYIEIENTVDNSKEIDPSQSHSNNSEKTNNKLKIDFAGNYNFFDVNEELEIFFNTNLTNISDKNLYYAKLEKLYSDLLGFDKEFKSKSLKAEKNISLKKKIDKLIEYVIEPKCVGPSFIMNHPIILSPLAKAHEHNKNIAERFEFFINKIELINSYSELNDSEEQKLRFMEQSSLKNNNSFDDEIHPNDEDFLEALAYGMPPTAGWGLGVDRLCMMFLGLSNIKEVILFPLMNVKKKI